MKKSKNISRTPKMFIFAGNNGSGKSTFRGIISNTLYTKVNIDPDQLEKGLEANGAKSPKMEAGKMAIKMVDECINNKENFSIETTLSGKLIQKQIKNAILNGYSVEMYYVYTTNKNINIMRVKERFQNGGHFIESEDIIRRHNKSIDGLKKSLPILDKLVLIENKEKADIKAIYNRKSNSLVYDKTLPVWIKSDLEELRDKRKVKKNYIRKEDI